MEKRHPEAVDILRGFVKARRAEFLSGGFYEPILSVLPEADRIMQVKGLTEYISGLLHYRPRGMWLAERVWEPQMPKCLSAAGVEYFPLDDYHFKLSGLDEDDLSGCFVTEDNGFSVKVFPGSEKLRYLIPFRGVDEIVSYFGDFSNRTALRSGGKPLLTMADDGEKFGVWPGTYKHCYEDGWLEKFFSALEGNSDWVETTTFSEYAEAFRPRGSVYLPTASYREMGEWVLPPQKGLEYEQVLGEMEKLFGERSKGMLRGGIWRSFLSKYPESNHLHKRMLMISAKAHEAVKRLQVPGSKFQGSRVQESKKSQASDASIRNALLQELWMGQCNDAYWHGIFGGLYLPHLRSSLYRHLIAAEALAEEVLNRKKGTNGGSAWKVEGDIDCNGFRDICVGNKNMTAFLTEKGGSLVELSLRKGSVNILDTLSRRPEAYHSRLSEAVKDDGSARTIHERLSAKEAGLSDYLVYDGYRRTSLLDRFFDRDPDPDSLMKGRCEDTGDFIGGIYDMTFLKRSEYSQIRFKREGNASGRRLKIEKTVRFYDSSVGVSYELKGKYAGFFGVEFNISLLGSPDASIHIGDLDLPVRNSGSHEPVAGFSVRDGFLGLDLDFRFDREMSLRHYPVETVSLSEEGVERIYQGTGFLFVNRLDFSGTKRLGFTMDFGGAK